MSGSNNNNLQNPESPASPSFPIMDEEELQLLYTWVDDIPLSRPKKNIARDFSDGVLMAEIVKHFFPKLVQLHNYSTASSYTQKLYNWNTLNRTLTSAIVCVIFYKKVIWVVYRYNNFFLQLNWCALEKVFKKLQFQVSRDDIDAIVRCKLGAIEQILKSFQVKVTQMQQKKLAEQRNMDLQSDLASAGAATTSGAIAMKLKHLKLDDIQHDDDDDDLMPPSHLPHSAGGRPHSQPNL